MKRQAAPAVTTRVRLEKFMAFRIR
jgi:hypothetical protein